MSDDEILDIATAAGLRFSMYIDDVETRAAIKRLAREVERAAYERAAALCGSPYSDETDDPYECGFNRAAEVIADAIRALGEQHDD